MFRFPFQQDMLTTEFYSEIVPIGDVVAASDLQGSRVSGDAMFHEGIIYPLFFTAVKCENAAIRGQAISLLVTSPWQEGPWHSARVAASLHETGAGLFLMNGFGSKKSI